MSSHKRGHDVKTGHRVGSLGENLGFRGQATPATFQAVCANNWGREKKLPLRFQLHLTYRSSSISKAPSQPSSFSSHLTWPHLLWPFPPPDTSESGRTGSGSSSSCPLDSFCWWGTHILHFSGLFAVKQNANIKVVRARVRLLIYLPVSLCLVWIFTLKKPLQPSQVRTP